MPLNNREVASMLRNCIELPGMSGREQWLLREMAHWWDSNLQVSWGDANHMLAAEVATLFNKCRTMINVPQPQV